MKQKLDELFIEELSLKKNEPEWMKEFRLESFKAFESLENPNFGPSLEFSFDDILYYKKNGKM